MHDNILDNKDMYTAQQLAAYIRQGIITLDELKQEGLDVKVRKEIEEILEKGSEDEDWNHACELNTEASYRSYLSDYPEGKYRSDAWNRINDLKKPAPVPVSVSEDEEAWNSIDKNDIDALKDFIRQFPKSKHRFEARRRINELSVIIPGKEQIENVLATSSDIPADIENLIYEQKASEDDLLEIISKDHNVLPPEIIKKLNGVIDYQSLVDAGIDEAFVNKLPFADKMKTFTWDPDEIQPLKQIPEGFTEIYFWGVPASGKTCAVGSIMSAIAHGKGVSSVVPMSDSQGSIYMMPLAASFREDQVCVLPPRTKVEETFEMRYKITDDKGKEHGLAFIDLSGELFECMHKSRSGSRLSQSQQRALNVLENILVNNKSSNPKIHFFVIEYGSENNRYLNLSQNDLLASCLNYLDDKDILKENTIGSYLIITKADKAEGEDIGQYIDTHYSGFYTGLKQRMTACGINTRRGESQVKRFPFSIGDVCFQKWCLYDPDWTQYIIDEIKSRSYGRNTGLLGTIIDNLQK